MRTKHTSLGHIKLIFLYECDNPLAMTVYEVDEHEVEVMAWHREPCIVGVGTSMTSNLIRGKT